MVVFLAVAAVILAVGVVLLIVHASDRRPPLRLPREMILEERGDELYDAVGPRPKSPVDRDAPSLDVISDGVPLRLDPQRLQGPRPPRGTPLVIDHDPSEHGPRPRDQGRDQGDAA
ncbi:hypothetical protein [Methylobacterium sp. ID0610]|uniref:hypothetical protein n=1 Tax=Methylobacterium carpenticola TaxID=3344827 RepID=UPI0036CD311D